MNGQHIYSPAAKTTAAYALQSPQNMLRYMAHNNLHGVVDYLNKMKIGGAQKVEIGNEEQLSEWLYKLYNEAPDKTAFLKGLMAGVQHVDTQANWANIKTAKQ